jgi:hypothetical protein
LLTMAAAAGSASAQEGAPAAVVRLDSARHALLQELAWRRYWPTWDTHFYMSPIVYFADPLIRCPVPIGNSGTACLGERSHFGSYRGPQPLLLFDERSTSSLSDRYSLLEGPQPIRPATVPMHERLAAIADTAPDNGWFTGHLVLLSMGVAMLNRSEEVLEGCRGNSGWCLALRAFVMDRYAYYREADSLFSLALEALPAATSCRWRDISGLLDSLARAAYSQLGCDQRRDFEERVWWLSDPLFLIAGNERRTAHYSRRVLDSLYAGGPSPFDRPDYSYPWNTAISDVLMRYGLADTWINVVDTRGWPRRVVNWALQAVPNYSFVPQQVGVNASDVLSPAEFRLRIPIDSARERYRPDYDFVADLSKLQVAAFPRGDSMLVVTTFDIPGEPVAAVAPFTAAIIFAAGHDEAQQRHLRHQTAARISVSTVLPRRNHLVSAELVADTVRVTGRSRFMLPAPDPRMSDLLLFHPSAQMPRSAEEAFAQMRGGMDLEEGERLGVYWEMHGLEADTTTAVDVSVVPLGERRRGVFAWVGALFGGGSGRGQLNVRWQVAGAAVRGIQSIVLDLGTLSPGVYRLEVNASSAGNDTLSAARNITIARVQPPAARTVRIAARNERPVPMFVALNQPLIRSARGYAEDVPLVNPEFRVDARTPAAERAINDLIINPLRKWCPGVNHSMRWCHRVVD